MKYGKLDYFVNDTRFNSFLDITLHSSFFAVPNREAELVLQFQKLSLDFWLSESTTSYSIKRRVWLSNKRPTNQNNSACI